MTEGHRDRNQPLLRRMKKMKSTVDKIVDERAKVEMKKPNWIIRNQGDNVETKVDNVETKDM